MTSNWYDDRRNLLSLFLFLVDRGDTLTWTDADQVAFLEKPHRWTAEYLDMKAVHEEHHAA